MMLYSKRILILSPASVGVREARFFRTKMIGAGIIAGVLMVGGMFFINLAGDDFLGLGVGQMSMLVNENRVLREQIKDIAGNLSAVERTLHNLSERGNELRVAVDLQKIDDDTREAAVGGAQQVSPATFLGGELNGILTDAQSLVDKLSREVNLQKTSYEEIEKRLDYNRVLFSHLPAIKPMAGAYSIHSFGMRNHPVLHVYKMHPGIDIINEVGTPVYAAGDGEVAFAGRTQGGYGVRVELSHGFGYSTLYAHLAEVYVAIGQKVKRGELIARSGRSGLVSGPHLHFEVRLNGALQNPVDFFFDDIDASRYRATFAKNSEQ
jgi:murein DD-endopeptidase MepM/ murein hydrolase activator NlpD